MRKIRNLENWLQDDPNQIQWLCKELTDYYSGTPIFPPTDENRVQWLYEQHLLQISEDPGGPKFISELRKQWSRKKFNDKKSNQSTSFTLRPDTLKKLGRLSIGKSRREVLEELIDFAEDVRALVSSQHKDDLRSLKAAQDYELKLLKLKQAELEHSLKNKNADIKNLRQENYNLRKQLSSRGS